MPLNPVQLTAEMVALMVGAAAPGSTLGREAMGRAMAAAYDRYSRAAVACSGLGPTVLDLDGLTSGMVDLFAGNPPTMAPAAQAWADASVRYWTGGVFGASGLVVLPGLGAPFAAALLAIWTAALAVPVPLPAVTVATATAMAAAWDAFTRTVTVRDTLVPPPTGCGPLPIV